MSQRSAVIGALVLVILIGGIGSMSLFHKTTRASGDFTIPALPQGNKALSKPVADTYLEYKQKNKSLQDDMEALLTKNHIKERQREIDGYVAELQRAINQETPQGYTFDEPTLSFKPAQLPPPVPAAPAPPAKK